MSFDNTFVCVITCNSCFIRGQLNSESVNLIYQTSRVGSKQWAYHKERCFSTNYFNFLRISKGLEQCVDSTAKFKIRFCIHKFDTKM